MERCTCGHTIYQHSSGHCDMKDCPCESFESTDPAFLALCLLAIAFGLGILVGAAL